MTYKEKRDEVVVMISFNRDDLGRTIISGPTTEFLEWHEKQLKAEYNQALEDLKAKLQSISGVQCDLCEGGYKECGCRIEGQNEGLKFAISEIEKLKKYRQMERQMEEERQLEEYNRWNESNQFEQP